MASPPPAADPAITSPASAIISPSSASRAELRQNFLKKMRPYPLRHEWVMWHEKNNPDGATENWTDRLKEIAQISTIQSFWQVFNNTPFKGIPMKDSLHLFKKNVMPLWEDPRNKNGGAWTFRVRGEKSHDFWKEMLVMTIGEQLQEVVEKGDDICGVSLAIRFNSYLILVWTRDADNEKSRDAVLKKVLEMLPEDMRPQPTAPYYKKHSDHKGYGEK